MGNVLIPGGGDSPDLIAVNHDNPLYLRVKKKKEEMTGWERIKFAFTLDEYGDFTPEMYRVKDATLISMFVGAIIGGVGRSRIAYMDFFRNNATTAFETPLMAKKVLQDKVVLGMGSGAFRMGWRLALFTSIYMTGSTAIAAYRGKYGIVDQVGGAGLAGFIYKFRDGPKAAISGTVFGSLLGVAAGCMTLATVKLVGMDMESANMEYYTRLSRRMQAETATTRNLRETEVVNEHEINRLESFHENLLAKMQTTAPAKAEQKSNYVKSAEDKNSESNTKSTTNNSTDKKSN